MFEVTSLCGQICLGKQGENLARMVYFDEPSTWKETFGEGRCELLHQRNGDDAPYPVVLEIEDGRVCWKITASDTALVGEGKCELHYSVDGVVVKSKIWTTSVLPSLGGEVAEPPEPYKGWVDEVLDAAEKIETGINDLVEETKELNEETRKVNEQTKELNEQSKELNEETQKSIENIEVKKANKSDVYTKNETETAIKNHKGVDVGAKGEGFNSVKFNSDDNETTGYKSFSGGAKNKVSNAQGVAFGYGNNNGGQNSMAVGYNNEIEEGASDASMAVGVNNFVKNRGIAIGRGLITSLMESYIAQVVLGSYNESVDNAYFILGSGKSNNRRNSIVVHSDGSVELLCIKDDLVVNGNVKAKNTYPQTITFDASGENITNEYGQTVAVWGRYNGKDQFNFSVNGSDGLLIRDCTELTVPVVETVLKCGIYSDIALAVSGTTMNTYLSTCGYVAEFPEDVSNNIIKTSNGLQVLEDVTINSVILKTTSEKIASTKYHNYKFSGKSKIETSVEFLIDILPETINTFREYKEPDGVSTSLHLTSPNGTVFKITVSDDGTLKTTKI